MIIFTFYGGMEAVIWVEVVRSELHRRRIAAAVCLDKSDLRRIFPARSPSPRSSTIRFVRFHLDFTEDYYILGWTRRRMFS
jgi:hypothetical protein